MILHIEQATFSVITVLGSNSAGDSQGWNGLAWLSAFPRRRLRVGAQAKRQAESTRSGICVEVSDDFGNACFEL